MKADVQSLADVEQVRLGYCLLMPSAVSLLSLPPAALMATWGIASTVPLTLITAIQCLLLVFGATTFAGTLAAALNCWQRRVAPSTAMRRVRQALLALLGHLAARAVVGPLLLILQLMWLRPDWASLGQAFAVFAALACALVVGIGVGLRWQGRAPRWTLDARRPLPSPGAWRGAPGWRRWRSVPRQDEVIAPWWGGAVLLGVWASHLAEHWHAQAWGHALPTGLQLVWVGTWMALMVLVAQALVIGPPLHWRARLAPRGFSAYAWARAVVLGSLLAGAVFVGVLGGVSALFGPPVAGGMTWSAGLPVLADMLQVVSWLLWVRGQRNTRAGQALSVFFASLCVPMLLAVAQACGLALHRDGPLVAIELLLAGVLAVAAQRAWARQDLNALMR